MKRREVIAWVMVILSLGCCLMSLRGRPSGEIGRFIPAGRSGDYKTPEKPEGTVSLNFGDAGELMKLPGIGESMASAIISERERNGFFHYPEDLLSVKGIGKAKLSKMRALLDMAEK